MIKSNNFLLLFFALLNLNSLLISQCIDNNIVNGSFDGEPGQRILAEGWETYPTFSPDLNNADGQIFTTPGYVWIGQPISSQDGET